LSESQKIAPLVSVWRKRAAGVFLSAIDGLDEEVSGPRGGWTVSVTVTYIEVIRHFAYSLQSSFSKHFLNFDLASF
jgi:hypothetical protein